MKRYGLRPIATIILLIFVSTAVEAAQKDLSGQRDESLRRGETRPALDPNQFQNPMVRKAYKAAKEIPWVLDSIYCYCFCEEFFQHKSLLSCYVDSHAAM